jgi:demethylspheroidene O-methyltransferase
MLSIPSTRDREPPALTGAAMQLRAWRDRLLADPRFQRWAAATPLVRRIAARRARALFDLCAGFVYSQVLTACVRLDAFALLAAGPRTVTELAACWRMTPEAAERLLLAAASLDLLEPRGPARYGLGPLGAALRGNPGVLAMIEHHGLLYDDLRDPVALLRGDAGPTALAGFWGYAGASRAAQAADALPADRVASYTQLMARSQQLVADDVLDACPMDRYHHLLDIGGGNGTFAIAAVGRTPCLRATVADLPSVAAEAERHIAAAGMAARIDAVGCDALHAALPAGVDVASLVRVLHDHDDEAACGLLRAAYGALQPGGTLLVAEPMASTPGAEPVGAAYFGFYLLAMGSGRARRFDELAAMATGAGFAQIAERATRRPLQVRVLQARRPGGR